MLRDDHSDYKWFFAFADTPAENAARAIIDWCAAFGVPNGLMSDGPTHFKNEAIRLFTKGLKTPHLFTHPYCPCSNGAVERLGKELLCVARSVISELQLRPEEWPDILPLLQSALNNAPSPQRGNVSPVTAFTGKWTLHHPSPPFYDPIQPRL
jgi:transposase InsO family protein